MADIDEMLLRDTGKSRELYCASFLKLMSLIDLALTLTACHLHFTTVSHWDPKPIGIASIAQVHLATDRETGQRVAVKLQHPNLEEWHAVE